MHACGNYCRWVFAETVTFMLTVTTCLGFMMIFEAIHSIVSVKVLQCHLLHIMLTTFMLFM